MDDDSIFIDGKDDDIDAFLREISSPNHNNTRINKDGQTDAQFKEVLLAEHTIDLLSDNQEIDGLQYGEHTNSTPSTYAKLNFSKVKMHAERKTLKCPLKDILNESMDYAFLYNIIDKANNVIFIASHFIRAYALYCFENNETIPDLTDAFVIMAIRSITKSSSGPIPKQNLDIRASLDAFFITKFVHLLYPNEQVDVSDIDKYKLDAKNLTCILRASADEMRIAYMNNIQLNFFKYLCQYVNQSFKKEHQSAIDKAPSSSRSKLRKELKAELRKVKDDLVYSTFKCDVKYHQWITTNRPKLLPVIDNKQLHEAYIKQYPYKYLPYMLHMNKFLEMNNLKTFQPIPLRTEFRNKYITLNTNAVLDILPNLENKAHFNRHLSYLQDTLWSFIFDLDRIKRKYKLNGYTFNYQIQTDGVGVSLNFIHNSEIPKKKQKSEAFKKARKIAKSKYKSMTRDQIDAAIKKSADDKKQRALESATKYKEESKRKKNEFKKRPIEEQQLMTLKNKLERDEFNYIEDLIKCVDFLEHLRTAHKEKRLTYCDPGKRSLLYMLGDNGLSYNYTNRMRINSTKRLERVAKIDNRKERTIIQDGVSIKQADAILSLFSHNTVRYTNFCEYLTMKLLIRSCMIKATEFNDYLVTQHWHSYIDKRRHEDKLLNDIGRVYGENAIYVVGDWGNKGRVSYMSTPGVGLKRLLGKRSEVYHIDEYLTSKLSYVTHEKCGNLKLVFKKKNGKLMSKEMHSILTYEMSNRRLGCINRDKNAVNNMKHIVEQLLINGKRPEEFSR